MENFCAVRIQTFQAFDNISRVIAVWIAAGGQYHAQRGACIPVGLLPIQLTSGGRQTMLHQIGFHPQHNGLGFRITEAYIVFQHFGLAAVINHQACIQKAAKVTAFGCHAIYGGADNILHHMLVNGIADHRGGRIGAHAAGIGALVPIIPCLVIL